MMDLILRRFGLDPRKCQKNRLGSGLIHGTWRISCGSNHEYILQSVNQNVFKNPEYITENALLLKEYLRANYPEYLFVSPLKSPEGDYLVKHEGGVIYRLLPFVPASKTIEIVSNGKEAYEAALQFGKFTALLAGFDPHRLHYTLPGFHNLQKRFLQFVEAKEKATRERSLIAVAAIGLAFKYEEIVQIYSEIVNKDLIPLRVIHHDTKISNVLFDADCRGLCVIDLDTVMPGYFFSDVGDMMRTYLSPYNEEEADFTKITIRHDILYQLAEGYLVHMASMLTSTEKALFVYAGRFMIYMQALRFLTDFLNNDIYYPTSYPNHNLIRALNQFTLLERYLEAEDSLSDILLPLLGANSGKLDR